MGNKDWEKSQTVIVNLMSPRKVLTFKSKRETPFKLFDHNKTGWLSKFLWWCLEKRGNLTSYQETIETWTYNPYSNEAQDFNSLLLEAAEDKMIHRGCRPEDLLFVVGTKDWQEMMSSPSFGDRVKFTTGPYGIVSEYYGRTGPFGIDVHVLPDISGIACIERVLIEREVPVGYIEQRNESLRQVRMAPSRKGEDYL